MPTTLQGHPIDQRTQSLGLPLPHIDNWHEDDVPRLRAAFTLIDLALQVMGQDILDRAAHVSNFERAEEFNRLALEFLSG